jgi:PhnB protein
VTADPAGAPAAASPVAPCLVVDDGDAAIDFYRRAFAARELFRATDPSGVHIVHAVLLLNDGTVMLTDVDAGSATAAEASPAGLAGRTSVAIHLAVTDADALWARAVAAGATAVLPLADQPWGERYGKLRDPFGHVWSIGAPLAGA